MKWTRTLLLMTAAEVVLIALLVCVFFTMSRAGEMRGARTYSTPQGITCDTVKSYYAMLGGMEGVKAYGRQHNVTLTPQQQRAALACLRK